MLIVLHGVAGGFDELIIAAVAVGVLWLAVKLAGRKSVDDDEDEDEDEEAAAEQTEVARPPATPLGQ